MHGIVLFVLLTLTSGLAEREDPDYGANFLPLPIPQDDDINCRKHDCVTHASCLNCEFPKCDYGDVILLNCTTKRQCRTQHTVSMETVCRYCYQTADWEQDCESLHGNCSVNSPPPRHFVRSVCRVKQHVLCIGRRAFYKRIRCNWTSGYKWSTALGLSLTLGGFGVDRFYLGLWKSGIGKLFSFGGLGVWTLVDVVLVATGYIGPADGSLYM